MTYVDPFEDDPAPEEADSMCLSLYDDELMATVDMETGEVLEVSDAPMNTQDIVGVAKWLGEKLTWAQAKQVELEAGKKFWLDKVDKMYNPSINKFSRLQQYLINMYTPMMEVYARECIFNPDGTKRGKSSSLKIDLLNLKFNVTRPRVDIIDQEAAIKLLREEIALAKDEGRDEIAKQLADSIKVTRTILKSAIPKDIEIEVDPEDHSLFYDNDELVIMAAEGRLSPMKVELKTYLEKKGLVQFHKGGDYTFKLG